MPGRNSGSVARIAVFLLLFLQAACARSPNDPAEVLKSFAGNWKVVSLDRGGKKSGADALKDMSVSVEGDKFTFVELSGPKRTKEDVTTQKAQSEEYIIQVNPAKSGDVDFVHTAGENLGKSRLGLYDLQGATLRICLASTGKARPVQIAPGRDLTLFVLERQP